MKEYMCRYFRNVHIQCCTASLIYQRMRLLLSKIFIFPLLLLSCFWKQSTCCNNTLPGYFYGILCINFVFLFFSLYIYWYYISVWIISVFLLWEIHFYENVHILLFHITPKQHWMPFKYVITCWNTIPNNIRHSETKDSTESMQSIK